jgi:hypothetical protein
MRPHIALALLPLLAACAGPPADTPLARCQQQADTTPEVKALLVDAGARGSDPGWQWNLAMARHKAVNDCLAAAGQAPRGGVEPVRRLNYGVGNF